MLNYNLKQINKLDELEVCIQKQLKSLVSRLKRRKVKEEAEAILVMFNKLIEIERKLVNE